MGNCSWTIIPQPSPSSSSATQTAANLPSSRNTTPFLQPLPIHQSFQPLSNNRSQKTKPWRQLRPPANDIPTPPPRPRPALRLGHPRLQPVLPLRVLRHRIPGPLHAAGARFRRVVLRHQQPGELGEHTACVVPADGGDVYERAGRHPHHVAGPEAGSEGGEGGGDIPAGGRLHCFRLKECFLAARDGPTRASLLTSALLAGSENRSGSPL